PVEYRSPRQRRDFEREVYRRWRECGYAVPEVLDEVDLGNLLLPGTVALALEYVDGPTLDARLRDSTQGLPRHERCLKEHDYRLVHFDSNARNILLRGNAPVHIDFEMGRTSEPLTR